MQTPRPAAVYLCWIPLGAGGHCVGAGGRGFEAIQAAREHRRRCHLYHAALVVGLGGDRYTIELTPTPRATEPNARSSPQAPSAAPRLRLYRYEVRCWRDGSIPDLGAAAACPCWLSSDPRIARRLLDLVAVVPTPAWVATNCTAARCGTRTPRPPG